MPYTVHPKLDRSTILLRWSVRAFRGLRVPRPFSFLRSALGVDNLIEFDHPDYYHSLKEVKRSFEALVDRLKGGESSSTVQMMRELASLRRMPLSIGLT
jgi:hypothetical protein